MEFKVSAFFINVNSIYVKLAMLEKLGLEYLKIGQPTATLSSGECQRIKLAKKLGKKVVVRDVLYLLDEPTMGLHVSDIEVLLACIQEIVTKGNTVLVIEHDMDMKKCAEYIIDSSYVVNWLHYVRDFLFTNPRR